MPTHKKISCPDNDALRQELDELYEQTGQVLLAQWSLEVAKHALTAVDLDYSRIWDVVNGFNINELWQGGKARMFDVRQAGLAVHKLARDCGDEAKKSALRVAGQAISSGHMREHAMVAADYAVKTVGLLHSSDMAAIAAERAWQIAALKKIIADNH